MIVETLAIMDLCGRTAQAVCTVKKISKAKMAVAVAKAELASGGLSIGYHLNEKRKQYR